MTIKPCIKCGARERSARGDCKPCKRARDTTCYAANPEKFRAAKATYRAAHPEKISASAAAYRAANREKGRARAAAYRAANPEKLRASRAAKYAANPDIYRARVAARDVANPEKKIVRNAAWRKDNPEKCRINKQNRRARERAVGGTLSKGIATKLFKLQRGLCPCCKQPLGIDFHLDHKMPVALGGSNTDNNMQLLRATCNMSKSAKHPNDFMRSRGFLL